MATLEEIEIQFPEAGLSRAGQLADTLALHIRELDETSTVKVSRGSPNAMDLGSILTIVLSAGSARILARGLADWIKKHGDPAIKIKCGKKEIVIQGGLSAEQKFELAKMALDQAK